MSTLMSVNVHTFLFLCMFFLSLCELFVEKHFICPGCTEITGIMLFVFGSVGKLI